MINFKSHSPKLLHCLLAVLLAVMSAASQTVTGTISGTVVDSRGGSIVGATVTIINERTGEARSSATNETGGFTIAALQPGSYTIKVEQEGFRAYERKANVLSANEHLSAGAVELTVGALTETVVTQVEGTVVQTETSDHSALLSSRQLETIAIRGRDVISMLRILPGVATNVDTEFLGGNFGTGTPNIQGTRATFNSYMVDGITGADLGSPQTFSSPINLDAIAEVKVQLNNYQAE